MEDRRMQQGNNSGITFSVEDLEAVLQMNRLLERENQELKQEITRLNGQINALKAHDIERKSMLWKKIQNSTEGNNKEAAQQTKNAKTPERNITTMETTCRRPDQPKESPGIPEPPQKPPKQGYEQNVTIASTPPPPPPPLPSRSSAGSRVVRRVPEVIEFYRYLNKRNAQTENRTATIGTPAEANSRNMIGEIENRSTYLSAIKSDVETQGEFINFLAREVESAAFTEISSLEAFVKWLDGELSCLVDERAVLKHFPRWPERKADTLREAACCYRDLKNLESEVSSFKDDPKQTLGQILRRIQDLQDRLERAINNVERIREGTCKRYRELQIPWEWMLDTGLIGQIKLSSLRLAREYMKRIARELQCAKCSSAEDLLIQGVRFAYRVHQFAGGFDIDTKCAFEELKRLHNAFLNQHISIKYYD
ncbi:hypothetical protein Nepgr_000668 [Nepenthes gracilis]|uniref:Protein CHUP1, chloroplastic n=1 Tax=Nepenthes gracilis TaxID=150966 RepID=A0AAD3P394_NEPGR|nr:hypothetical protein Nepgr_000668 [Nepenthes gracilis]